MLLEPGVVLGTLDGEIEGNFQTMLGGGGHQPTKIVAAAQLRVNRVMAAFGAADCIGAARVARRCMQGIVAAFAVLRADGVDGREIQHIEAHVANHRQACVDIVERAMTRGVVSDRTGEQLVPTGELRRRAIDIQGKFGAAGKVAAVHGLGHQVRRVRAEQLRHLVIGVQLGQALLQRLEFLTQHALTQFGALAQHQPAFFEFQRDLDTGVVLLLQVVAVRGERVDPGLDAEQVQADVAGGELGQPQVVAWRVHGHAMPAPAVGLAPVEHYRQAVVAIAVDLAAYREGLTADRLGREGAAVEHRLGVFDHDARRQQRLRQAQGLIRVIVGLGHAFEGLFS
ncbi:hypothetical protein D9M71_374990 [compost metagenome]